MTREEFWQRAYLASLVNSGTKLAATKADESVDHYDRKFNSSRNIPKSPNDIPFMGYNP